MAVVADVPRCVASITGGDAAWQKAVADLDKTLGTGDCRKIDVHVGAKGAVVIYVALDGRIAIRNIAAPDELGPTVDALRVSLPEEPQTPPEPAAKLAPVAKTEKVAPPSERSVPPAPAQWSPRLLFALYGGVRTGWPGSFVSPLLGVSGNLGFGDWSLGIYGEWETSYASRSEPLPEGFQLFAVAGGFTFGRRMFDRAVTVELRIGGAVVSEEGSEAAEVLGDDRAEARVGLHVRTSFPADSPVRARVGFGVEVSPTVLSRSKRSIDASLPTPPAWGLVLSLGFEADASGAP
jgi:hypothetical protein